MSLTPSGATTTMSMRENSANAAMWLRVTLLLLAGFGGGAELNAASPAEDGFFSFLPAPVRREAATRSTWRVVTTTEPWASSNQWHPDLKEENVLLARLFHESKESRSWSLGVGRGGQVFSLWTTFGETIPPQHPDAPWMDEVWQLVTLYGKSHRLNAWPEPIAERGNGFVHQAGPYAKMLAGGQPFYSPLLASCADSTQRSFSTLSWGQIPTASTIRSEALVYARYLDLGDGIIQADWVVANYAADPLTEVAIWGGHRSSLLPEQVLSNPDGSYRFFTPFIFRMPDSGVPLRDTGGWAAAVKNADDPNSQGVGFVFGNPPDKAAPFQAPSRFDSGDSRHGRRDYSVQSIVVHSPGEEGSVQFIRTFFVVGSLNAIQGKANQLVSEASYKRLKLSPAESPLIALAMRDGLPCRGLDGGGHAHAYAFTWPVEGTRPLFLLRDRKTKSLFLSSDPYARCASTPFDPGNVELSQADREAFAGKPVFNVPRDGAEIVEFLGFVPASSSVTCEDCRLVSIASVIDPASFDAGSRHTAEQLFLLER